MATEVELLVSLGITDPSVQNAIITGAARLLVLDVSAHLDWDWLLPFPVLSQGGSGQRTGWYFISGGAGNNVGPANTIFTLAAGLLSSSDYHYSICEMGFLRAFAESQPPAFASLSANSAANANLRIAGGGITSPDSLLPHGEAFIRAYLLGHVWLAQNLDTPPAPVSVWLPDDFGHDPNLPVVVQAMGLSAAGFARLPGSGTSPTVTISGGPSMKTTLTNGPIDFNWTSPDGSSILGHWMVGGEYSQGNGLSSSIQITGYLDTNANPSPTPYIYVPVLADFSKPNTAITTIIQQSSPMKWLNPQTKQYETVYLASGAFEDYAQLVAFHPLTAQPFNPNPYYTGCYGSRPALKILHHRATRALLAAEVFNLIGSLAQSLGTTASLGMGETAPDVFLEAWNLLAPSTHHDYITGTAIPDVYHREQMLLSRQAAGRAEWLLGDAMQTIAASITSKSPTGVVVFNPLGFARSEVVEVPGYAMKNLNVQKIGQGYQNNDDGSLLFLGSAPSMGYQTDYLGSRNDPPNPAGVSFSPTSCVLSNGLVQATLTTDDKGIWGLVSCIDVKGNNRELLNTSRVANDLLFYYDAGNEYHFGMEMGSTLWKLKDVRNSLSSPSITLVEQGPLRVHVVTSVTYQDKNVSIDYIREYILCANEPMLRMRTTGAAPMLSDTTSRRGSSVVVSFPLVTGTNGITGLQRGTPYHWTDAPPSALYWSDQTFVPAHNFVLPFADDASSPLCAIYHSGMPAWGITWNGPSPNSDNRSLYGCLFRNGDGNYFGWVNYHGTYTPYGTDSETHVQEYALRVPTGLGDVTTGAPLCEALAFASPMRPLFLEPIQSVLPDQLSLLSSTPGSLVTVAKAGTVNPADVVLRVYTAGTAAKSPTDVTVTVSKMLNRSGGNLPAAGINALEQPLPSQNGLNLSTTSGTVSFTANTALTTIALTPS